MYEEKKKTSIISLALCALAIVLICAALVITTNNSAAYRASQLNSSVVDRSAYVKVYVLEEVQEIAKQAYADNYLAYYDGEVKITGFENLIMAQILRTVPNNQLENYNIFVYNDGITVEYK